MDKRDTTAKKPNWLLNLEQESWQAELIISGLAIFGSLQLPDLIDRFGQWGMTHFSADLGFFLIMFFVYLHFTSGILIFAFITHFILRAVWIGFIGLNSVFPEGIKTDGGMYSKIFMEKFKADYVHKNYGIESLDKFCSGVFGLCTLVILFSLAFCTIVLIGYGLHLLSDMLLPPMVKQVLTYSLLFLMMIPSVMVIVLKQKKYEQNEKLQNRFYKFFNWSSVLMFHIFRRPAMYLSFLFSTNLKVKQYLFSLFGLFILLYGFGFYRLINSGNILIGDQDVFYDYYARPDRLNAENYEEYLTKESAPIYSAIIPSKLIKGEMMNVFIPIFSNEETIYTDYCAAHSEVDATKKDGDRAARRQYYTDCYQHYHRIYVNDQLKDLRIYKRQKKYSKSREINEGRYDL